MSYSYESILTYEDAVAVLPPSEAVAKYHAETFEDPDLTLDQMESKFKHIVKTVNHLIPEDKPAIYYPYFLLSSSGLRFYDFGLDYSSTVVGARLRVKTAAAAIWLGKTHLEFYKKHLLPQE